MEKHHSIQDLKQLVNDIKRTQTYVGGLLGQLVWQEGQTFADFVCGQVFYCEMCSVVEVVPGDKYCNRCVNVIVDYLAVQFDEQESCDKGLY